MNSATKNEQSLYNFAKASLGKHMTLDPNVPAILGCAEAVSAILKLADFKGLPEEGIAGTLELNAFFLRNPNFEAITIPEPGAILVSPTPANQTAIHGHTGILGINGIMSNNSDSGLFLELWNLDTWKDNYVGILGLPMNFYRWLDTPMSY